MISSGPGSKDGVAVAPPIAVLGLNEAISLPNLVLWATLAYTVLMAARLIWRWRNEYVDRHEIKYGRRVTDTPVEDDD